MSATRGNRSARLAEAKRAAESLTDDAVVSKVDAKRARASVAGDHDETDTVELVASATEPYSGSEAAETQSPVIEATLKQSKERAQPLDQPLKARGEFVRALPIAEGEKHGIAVNTDATRMIVTYGKPAPCIRIYSLPDGDLVREIDDVGLPRRCCFVPTDPNKFLVADKAGAIKEFDLDGKRHREIPYPNAHAVACNGKWIVAGNDARRGCNGHVFDYTTGEELTGLAQYKARICREYTNCILSARFSPTGQIVCCESTATYRLTIFAGSFVNDSNRFLPILQHVGMYDNEGGLVDVEFTAAGEFVVADAAFSRISVFNAEGSELVRVFGGPGVGPGKLRMATALASARGHLYVLDGHPKACSVQLFA